MELKVTTLEGKDAGSVQLSDAIFGLEPRADIIARCVQWQLNKRQAGTHKTKGRAEIWRNGAKMGYRRAPAAPVTARPACRSSAARSLRPGRAFARYRPAEEGPRAGVTCAPPRPRTAVSS